MRLFIQATYFFIIANVAEAVAIKDQCATAVLIKGKSFVKQPLVKGLAEEVLDVSVHDKTGDIFYVRHDNKASGDDSSKLFVLKGGIGEPQEIRGAEGPGYAVAVDNYNDEVEFSIGDKLYVYKRDNDTVVIHDRDTVPHDPIIHMFYNKDAHYMLSWPEDRLYKVIRGGGSVLDRDLYYGKNLVVDSKENFYFTGRSGSLYVTPKDASKKIKLDVPGFSKGSIAIFALDRKDVVFLTVEDKLYKVTADNTVPQFISDLEIKPTSVAFDKFNNPIIGHKGGITKYVKIVFNIMHFFIQAACFIAVVNVAAASALKDRCADAYLFNGEHLIRETIVEITEEPFDIAVHDKTGDIFYIASDDSSFKLVVLKSGSGEPQEIKGVKNVPYAIAVDNDHDNVDFSIGDNLYTYNRDANTAVAHEKDTEKHEPIMQLFYTKNARYLSTGDKLYKVTRSQKVELDSDLYYGDSLVVDSKDNLYFIGKDNFPYVTPKGATKKIKLEIPGVDMKDSALFAIDRKDNVYLMMKHKVYKVTADDKTPLFVGDLKNNPTSVAFDKSNNPIIGYKGGIYKIVKIDC